MPTLAKLQDWYWSQCSGDWEHDNRFSIHTLDNPGWRTSLRLEDSKFYHLKVPTSHIERTEHNWISVQVGKDDLKIFCGPKNLEEALDKFLDIVGG